MVVNGSNRPALNAALARRRHDHRHRHRPLGPIDRRVVTFYREVAPGDFEDVDVRLDERAPAPTPSTPLAPGTYVVRVRGRRARDGVLERQAPDAGDGRSRIVVGVGSTSTANATLGSRPHAAPERSPVPPAHRLADVDVTVEARYDVGGGDFYWDYETDATTTATGAWSVDVGAGTYRVELPARAAHVTEWWNNAATAAARRRAVVVTTADVGSINAQLAPAAVLKGTVSGPDGPVFGEVTVYPAAATDLGDGHSAGR